MACFSAAVLIGSLITTGAALAQPAPEDFYNILVNNSNLDQEPGESWAWHAASSMGHFTKAYEAWGDTAWLDQAVRYYDFVIGHMREGPDGYKGWIGPYIYDNEHWVDVHIGDAILINPMLEFARIVKADPELDAQYGEHADRYVALAEQHLFEKWDERGTYHDDGRYGAYQMWDHYADPDDLSQWHHRPEVRNSNLGQPQNKNNSMGIAALRLWQITGRDEHLDRAVKVFSLAKSRMQRYEDTLTWNYWEPTVRTDITGERGNPSRHWINVHPYRNYQAGEVGEVVEAYHAGIVFDETDIQRIINTNLEVMWNGDRDDPQFTNSNAHLVPDGLDDEVTAGALWSALADFNQTIRDLRSFADNSRGQIDRAYFENVTATREPSFTRHHAPDGQPVRLFDRPLDGSTRYLYMALTIPSTIAPGDEMVIGVRSHAAGELEVAVYDQAGQQNVHTIYAGPLSAGWQSEQYWTWDGRDDAGAPLPPGDYRIRWTLSDDGYREAPVTIRSAP